MGGELNVRTEPGEGSVFVLRLDLPEVTLVPEDTLPLLSPGLRVAVIEDEPVNRKVLQTMLETAGCIDRYHAMLSRPVVVGEPTPRHVEAADTLQGAE